MKIKELFTRFPDFKQITELEIENIEINNITVLDAPDFFRWSKPNELPISSGYIFSQELDFIKTIQSCLEHNVVALAIKVDRYLKEIPKEVVEYAEINSFPLIYIPAHYSFSDIILPVMNDSLYNRIIEIEKSEKMRDQFIKLALNGNNIAEIISYLHEAMKVEVLFENFMTHEFYQNGHLISPIDTDSYPYLEQTIVFGSERLGKLYFKIRAKELTHSQKIAINYATRIIQLIYKEKLSLQKVEEDYKSDLVEDICNNNIKNIQELNLRSKLYGWQISNELIVGIFDIDNYKEQTIKLGEESSKLSTIHNQMYKEITNYLKGKEIVFYSFKKSDSYIFIFESATFPSKDLQDQLLDNIRLNLRQKFGFSFTVGLGNKVNNVLNTYKSYQQAMEGVRLGRILHKGNLLIHYQDIEPYTLLAKISQDVSGNHSIMHPIMVLQNYDYNRGTNYFSDLKELIDSDWNVSKFSKNRIIHYNTAKYRLNKIQEITQVDFNKSYNKFNIEFALKLFMIKNGN